ncbi:carbamoyltransferase N-terminal domain-containing protein [Mucilaginibacter sp. AW1-3]
MIICGLKLTHDAGVALIDNGKLIFSIELEKLDNNPRYCTFSRKFHIIELLLNEYGYTVDEVDSFAIDGWNDGYEHLQFFNQKIIKFKLNGYDPITGGKSVLDRQNYEIENCLFLNYNSYQHISSHIVGSYCTSSFAKQQQSAFIMVWDGAIGAQLYYFDASVNKFLALGWIHYFYGACYAEFANKFPPFSKYDLYDMAVPGKLMAYIGSGVVDHILLENFKKIYLHLKKQYHSRFDNDCRRFSKEFQALAFEASKHILNPENILATYHEFLSHTTVTELTSLIECYPQFTKNLCYAGGCALNIKWNSAIRSSNLFTEIWIPPFPNDSGSALGTACCEMVLLENRLNLQWDTYSGRDLEKNVVLDNKWNQISCSMSFLANVMYLTNQPVVFLNGRAELGPRALGNRSILASPVTAEMKAKLNTIKLREPYRPVAPICLEEFAETYFTPGSSDPLMLFDHVVREEKKHLIPAVLHLDGTARVQTVNEHQNRLLFQLLSAFHEISGIPLLCNTSANMNGKGFFPDVVSAIKWGKCNIIWSDDVLYIKKSSTCCKLILQLENTFKNENHAIR